MRREERVCKQCDSDEVEDVGHWMVECDAFDSVWEPLLKVMKNVDEEFKQKMKEQKTSTILTHACSNYHILNVISALWAVR